MKGQRMMKRMRKRRELAKPVQTQADQMLDESPVTDAKRVSPTVDSPLTDDHFRPVILLSVRFGNAQFVQTTIAASLPHGGYPPRTPDA